MGCWWCIPDAPLTPFAIGARPEPARERSAGPSDFPLAHGVFTTGRLRFMWEDVFGHAPASPAGGTGRPLAWELLALEVTVEVDEFDDVDETDDTDDDELERGSVFRGMNMVIPLTSSEFPVPSVCPPLIHPDRLMFAKLGGFATAVMGEDAAGDGARQRAAGAGDEKTASRRGCRYCCCCCWWSC